jgi:hypothetical protein
MDGRRREDRMKRRRELWMTIRREDEEEMKNAGLDERKEKDWRTRRRECEMK